MIRGRAISTVMSTPSCYWYFSVPSENIRIRITCLQEIYKETETWIVTDNFSGTHAESNCQSLENNDFLLVVTQIASGVLCVSTHSFVNKEIAARNCIIVDNSIINISDMSSINNVTMVIITGYPANYQYQLAE